MKIKNIAVKEDARGKEYLVQKYGDSYIYGYYENGQVNRLPNDHPLYKIKRATRERLIDKIGRGNIFNINGKIANDGTAEYDLKTNNFIIKDFPQGSPGMQGKPVTGLTARAIWNQLGVGIGGTDKTQQDLIAKGKKQVFGKQGMFGKYGSMTRFMQGKDDNDLARDTRLDPTASSGEKLFTYLGLKAMGFGPDGSRRQNLKREIPLDPELKQDMDTYIKFGHGEYLVKILRDIQLALKNAQDTAKNVRQNQTGPNKKIESKIFTLENREPDIPIGSILNIQNKQANKPTKYQWNGENWVNTTLGSKVAKRQTQNQLNAIFRKRAKGPDLGIDKPSGPDGMNTLGGEPEDSINAQSTSVDDQTKPTQKYDPATGQQVDQDPLAPPPMPGEEPDVKKPVLDPFTKKLAVANMQKILKSIEIPRPKPNDPEYEKIQSEIEAGIRSPYAKLDQELIKFMKDTIDKGQIFPAFKYAQEQTARYFQQNRLGRDKESKFYNPKFDQSQPGDRKLRNNIQSKINKIEQNRKQFIDRNIARLGADGSGGIVFKTTTNAEQYFKRLKDYNEQIDALRVQYAQQSDDETEKFKAKMAIRTEFGKFIKQLKAENEKLKAQGQPQVPIPTEQDYFNAVAQRQQQMIQQGQLLPPPGQAGKRNKQGDFRGMSGGSKKQQYRKEGDPEFDRIAQQNRQFRPEKT